jgi:hypothetical protein
MTALLIVGMVAAVTWSALCAVWYLVRVLRSTADEQERDE